MSPASIHNDLADTRKGVLSGHHEQSHAICQDVLAMLVHRSSFQFRLVDDVCSIKEKGQGVVRSRQGVGDV